MLAPIDRAVARALSLTLAAAIIATGVYAVHLTHVQASVTVRFGNEGFTDTSFVAPKVDPSQGFLESGPVIVEPLLQPALAPPPDPLPVIPDKPRSRTRK